MKKLFLFLAALPLLFSSCSSNDDNTSTAINSSYLQGTWVETAPTAGAHTFVFWGNTAILYREGDTSDAYDYTFNDNELRLTLKESDSYSVHVTEKVDSKTMKVGNMYPQTGFDAPLMTTFKKQ